MVNRGQNLQSLLDLLRKNLSAFLLGLTVLLVLVLIVSLTFGGKQKKAQTGKGWAAGLAQLFIGKREPTAQPEPNLKTYQVKEGDDLWKIAEATYGSGYNAYDIAQANKLENPDLIEPGQNLVLPSVVPKTPTKGEAVGVATEEAMARPAVYTVQPGDYLWQIALNYYGDGSAWVKIAQVNNLVNPDIVYAGTVLTLP